MPVEPSIKRVTAFFDGQNLYHSAKEAFGYRHPNFDPRALAEAVCRRQSWVLGEVRFYTGVPDARDNEFWNHFWTAKLAQMGRSKIFTFTRALRYRNQTIRLADSEQTVLVGQEKGIDVRVALDIVRLARRDAYDVGLIFSQDQDLSEAADEVRLISREHGKWIKVASAFPSSPTSRNGRGIDKTDWIRIDRATYDLCLDGRDYRLKKPPPS